MEDEKPWHEYAATDEDKLYEEAVRRIKNGIKGGLSFEQAAKLIEIKDAALRASITEDALKVLIAEMHFTGKKPLEEVARALRLPIARLEKARKEMFDEVEAAAIEKYKSSLGKTGNA